MPFTNMERTFLKGGRNPHQGIRSNPYQVKPKPVPKPAAKPMSFSQGTQWNGPLSKAESLNQNAGKWLSKDSTTKSGFAKNASAARSVGGGGMNWGDILKTYGKIRLGLDGLIFPGTAMAPSWQEMGFEMPPTIWHNEGPTGRYRRQDGN